MQTTKLEKANVYAGIKKTYKNVPLTIRKLRKHGPVVIVPVIDGKVQEK